MHQRGSDQAQLGLNQVLVLDFQELKKCHPPIWLALPLLLSWAIPMSLHGLAAVSRSPNPHHIDDSVRRDCHGDARRLDGFGVATFV